MKIAIIDGVQQDIGLKLLFPEADYYVENISTNVAIQSGGGDIKKESTKVYNIDVKTDWRLINDKNYDFLFIIISLYDTSNKDQFYKKQIAEILQKELEIINNNNFKKVVIFDNYDYDYDPNEFLQNDKIDFFFKRNYNKTKKYKENVIPFPFIMFGKKSLIEKIDENCDEIKINKINRIFFSGSLFIHDNKLLNYTVNRKEIYSKISNFIYNPGTLEYGSFLKCMRESKYGLDLNGVGNPNKRTFEILSQNSLRIGEYNDLKWPFDEEFSKETIFKTSEEFIKKINYLEENPEIYNRCLENQKNIYDKYFNKMWLKKYIMSHF